MPSERSACLTDAECQGKCLPDDACHGICLPDEECQGICLLDAARVLQKQSVKADVVRTTGATACALRTNTVRAFPFWTQSVKVNVVRTIRATTSTFWTSDIAIQTQRVLYMQSVKANGI